MPGPDDPGQDDQASRAMAADADPVSGEALNALASMAGAVTLPVCDLPDNVIVVPALHGSLLGDPEMDRMAHRFLSHEQVAGPPGMRDTAEVIAAAAWRMPSLAPPPHCNG
jgi:hypothetical protein